MTTPDQTAKKTARGTITLHLSKRAAKKVLEAINGPSITDPILATVYVDLFNRLQECSK